MQVRPGSNLSPGQKWTLALMLAVPLAVAVVKLVGWPGSAFLVRYSSLSRLPQDVQHRVRYILLVPFGALVVVFFRVTLGIRVLGPFRSILLAVAYHVTGIVVGLTFTCIVVGVIVLVRPLLKAIRLPYFGRVSVILSAVALILLAAILLSVWLDHGWLSSVAYFPIVVLCLAGEGFARTLTREGVRSALWRGGTTVLLAALIALVSGTRGFERILASHPELLIAQIACIVLVSEYLNWRLLAGMNPTPVSPTRASRKRTRRARPSGTAADAPPPSSRAAAGTRSADE